MSGWDGVEKRKDYRVDLEMRDKIIEMHSDVKHMVKWSEEHERKDDQRFNDVNKDIENGKKIVYGVGGGLAVLEILAKLFKF